MPADYDAVLRTLGKAGDFKANVLKVNIPRNDLKVTVAGSNANAVRLRRLGRDDQRRPAEMDVMMGDLVLTKTR